MSANTQKIEQLIKEAPDKSAALSLNIDAVDDQIDELTEQATAWEDGVCGVAETDLTAYLTGPKLIEVQLTYPTAYLAFGGTYGTIDYTTGNITDWVYNIDVITPNPTPPPPTITTTIPVYWYIPGLDPIIDVFVADYAFGNDQLTRPLTSGATYGLFESIDVLGDGRSILTENKAKIDDSVDVLSRYT